MSDILPIIGRGYCYEDLKVGFRFRTHRRTIAESDLTSFVNLTWLTEELFAVADDARERAGDQADGEDQDEFDHRFNPDSAFTVLGVA